MRAGKKVQLALIGSQPRAFQRSIGEPCTLPLSPPKGGTKCDIAVFASKIQLLSKNVCYKLSLCENIQRQSCSYIIPLSNGPWMDCWRCPHLPKIDPALQKMTFRQISLNSAAAVRANEKSSIITNRKSTMRYPSSHG